MGDDGTTTRVAYKCDLPCKASVQEGVEVVLEHLREDHHALAGFLYFKASEPAWTCSTQKPQKRQLARTRRRRKSEKRTPSLTMRLLPRTEAP